MTSDNQPLTKMSGYLEKKGRKKMMSCYKKYWFVLEGRLLLYYKSKDEYDAISPCKGSISLGATCNVKPCPSSIGVFQIENKTTTITLRAESRPLQHQWMQAIMSALNQGNNGNRLYHFRYSLGELSVPVPKENEEIETTNSKIQSSFNSNENKLIEKLKRQGAQACCIDAAHVQSNAMSLLVKQRISVSHESLSLKTKYARNKSHTSSKNRINMTGEYDRLDFKTEHRVRSVGSLDSVSDAIYERVLSDDSVFAKSQSLDEVSDSNEVYYDIVKNRQDGSLSTSNKDFNTSDGILDQNPVYGLQDRPKSNSKALRQSWKYANNNKKYLITENDCYWSAQPKKDKSPKMDCNDNTIKLENRRTSLTNISTKSSENMYYEANHENSNDNVAEYVDVTYTEVEHPVKKGKKKRRFSSFCKKNKSSKEKTEHKIIKSESFLQRVFIKHRKKAHSTSTLQSNNHEIMAEKLYIENGNKARFLKKCHSELASTNKEDQEMIYDEVTNEEISNTNRQNKSDDESCPILPPRNNRSKRMLKSISVSHGDKNPSLTRTQEIDEILNDLNKETQSTSDDAGEGNVKKLIKRFSMIRDDGVEIRVKNWDRRNGARETSSTDSNDLNKLLDELAKVTTAPIMTPGVTTSLINPEITDAELMNIIPIRTRRLSDPDYDVPRPHRSLTNIQKKDNNALQATRFFGPILNSSNLETHQKRPPTPPVDYSSVPSMTPDSLEVTFRKSQEDHNSYHSHEYLNYQKRSHNHIDYIVQNNLYDDPRLLYKAHGEFRLIDGRDIGKIHCNQEIENNFIDSLET